jgi:hypothetical protein
MGPRLRVAALRAGPLRGRPAAGYFQIGLMKKVSFFRRKLFLHLEDVAVSIVS